MYAEDERRRKRVVRFILGLIVIGILLAYYMSIGHTNDEIGYVMPGEQYRDFNGLALWRYYAYFWGNKFAGYPWVIKVAFFIVQCALMVWLVGFISMIVYFYKATRRHNIYANLKKHYYESLKEIMTTERNLSTLEINKRLHLQSRTFSNATYTMWLRLFRNIHADYFDKISDKNTLTAADNIGLINYAIESLTNGNFKEKICLLQSIHQLSLPLPPGLLSRLINDKNERIRKQSRIYYCATNPEDPFGVLDENFFNNNFFVWDEIELHDMATYLVKKHKLLPPILPLINSTSYPLVKSYLIKEIGYWGNEDEIRQVMKQFDSKDVLCRDAAYECMGACKFKPAEDAMMRHYMEEKDETQMIILLSLLKIHTGKAEDFLRKAYMTSESISVKRRALYCLLHYSEKGKTMFYELEKDASDGKRRTFLHVKNVTINGVEEDPR